MPDTIGFIGLGIMGKPMAHNLLKAGFPVIVHNRHQEVTDELVAAGASPGARPRDIAASCDVLITMLPASPQVEEVLLGADGVIEGARAGLIVIDMSTISPIVTRTLAARLAAHGITMLDAPVSGGDKGAIAGTLSIMIGGDEDTFKRCITIFQALGKTIVYVGGSGAGQVVKAPGGRIRTHHKDLGIVLELGRMYGVSLPVTALVDQMFASLEIRGQGNLDHTALLSYLEDLAAHYVGQ